jgi:hypothetical protein
MRWERGLPDHWENLFKEDQRSYAQQLPRHVGQQGFRAAAGNSLCKLRKPTQHYLPPFFYRLRVRELGFASPHFGPAAINFRQLRISRSPTPRQPCPPRPEKEKANRNARGVDDERHRSAQRRDHRFALVGQQFFTDGKVTGELGNLGFPFGEIGLARLQRSSRNVVL